ncbi:MAG TPA: hypothetical protein VMW15_02355 [Terracidiphilus sp.]|nr:hypothetical protein [Terracidiphilus sp.]
MRSRFFLLSFFVFAATFLLPCGRLNAQNLTLEGQTGGFITPTAYVVYGEPGHFFSHPAFGYHFINANKVIGDVHTFSVEEGFANRAEAGYTRSVHWTGDSPLFSALWHEAGMNIFNGKAVAVKDGQFGFWTPGVAAGFVVRTNDKFVTGRLDGKSYTNGDVYAVATKTWLHPPLPFLLNFGWKFTNASIYGLGGQATRFGGRLFGGVGIPLPFFFKTAIVPSAGFSQEPPTSKNLGAYSATSVYLVQGRAHLPTTLDYAIRVTQKDHPHFALDFGIGQVAGNIGTTYFNPPGTSVLEPLNVDLQARHVLGIGLSIRP